MAGSKANYYENAVLNVLGGTSITAPATVYVALFTATPGEAGPGTEVTGGSYARKAVTNNATNWPASTAGSKSNGTDITFVTPTASWGTVTSFGIFDAATSGNCFYYGDLALPKAVASGEVFAFLAGNIVITED